MSPETTKEHPQFKTMEEAIQAFQDCLPDNIRQLYCVGHIWEQILQSAGLATNTLVLTPVGYRPAKCLLAAYAVNVIAQGMLGWCALDTKMDPQTRELVGMTPEEKKIMVEQQIPMIIEFVSHTLGIPVILNPEPFVQL